MLSSVYHAALVIMSISELLVETDRMVVWKL